MAEPESETKDIVEAKAEENEPTGDATQAVNAEEQPKLEEATAAEPGTETLPATDGDAQPGEENAETPQEVKIQFQKLVVKTKKIFKWKYNYLD